MSRCMYVLGMSTLVGRASLAEWPDGVASPLPKPDLTLLDRSLRRGLSDVTRIFMHVALGALSDAGALQTLPRVVFASAFGEIATAEAMLAQAFDDNSASPVRFRQSVHNTAEGLYSISAKNCEPATALAAGWETVGMGLLESHAQLQHGAANVLLVFAEEPVPHALSSDHHHGGLGAAFLLTANHSHDTRAVFSVPARGEALGLRAAFGAENHPLGPALALAQAIESGQPTTVIVGEGDRPYCVRVTPGARA